jgi:hypothetical protein
MRKACGQMANKAGRFREYRRNHRDGMMTLSLPCRLTNKRNCIFGGLGFYTRLSKEPQIAEPFDEAELPRPKWDTVAVRQTAAHPATVRQCIARMPPIGVNMHLDVRRAHREHRAEVFHRPHRMTSISRSRAGHEGRGNIARNRRRRPIARERRRAGIDDANKVRP